MISTYIISKWHVKFRGLKKNTMDTTRKQIYIYTCGALKSQKKMCIKLDMKKKNVNVNMIFTKNTIYSTVEYLV